MSTVTFLHHANRQQTSRWDRKVWTLCWTDNQQADNNLPELPRWAANVKITGALRLVVAAVVTTTAVVTNDVKPLNGCRTLSLQQPEFPQWLYNTNEISRYHVISCYCCCCCCWDTGVEGLTLSGATLIPIHWSLWTKKDKSSAAWSQERLPAIRKTASETLRNHDSQSERAWYPHGQANLPIVSK